MTFQCSRANRGLSPILPVPYSYIETIDIDGKRLKLYIDPTGRDGIEFQTAVGVIDILAIDRKGAFVVFELKRGRVPDQAIGQIARYMGWLKKTISKDHPVRGIIVAKVISRNLRFAIAAVQRLAIRIRGQLYVKTSCRSA